MKLKGQGSLEYLIIIAAVLAIAAIVVLFLTGAFTGASSTGDISNCKTAAAQCATEIATSASQVCSALQGSTCYDACAINATHSIGIGIGYTTTYPNNSSLVACINGEPDKIISS